MKKLLILIAVLVFSTATMAGTVTVVVQPPGPYAPSDIVTVTIVGNGFPHTTAATKIAKMEIDSLTASAGTAEAVGALHSTLLGGGIVNPGTLVNVTPDLITGILGGTGLQGPWPIDGDALYTYEFHIPEVPPSTIITLGIDGLVIKNPFQQPIASDVVGAQIHVIPEPMTIALLGLGGLFLRRRK